MAKLDAQKGNAPMAATTEASNVKTQLLTEGSNMPNSTAVTTNKAITVPFHGAELYVVEHNGQPYTPMKPVVEGMGLTWHGQHAKIKSNNQRWGVLNLRIPTASGIQEMICAPLRKLAGWLATIDPGRVKNPEVRNRVVQYQNECDDALWQYWSEGLAVNPRTYSMQRGQTLTEEQAATLRNLLTSGVKKLPKEKQGGAMVKGWSKLKAHFKTDYRHIPADEFHEAVNILARHVAEWEVVDEEPAPKLSPDDTVRLDMAFTMASQAAAKVQRAVFNSVMTGNEDWKHSRYMVNLDTQGCDQEVVVRTKQVERNACVLPMDSFHLAIEDSVAVDAQTLTKLASVCMKRLGSMAARSTKALPA